MAKKVFTPEQIAEKARIKALPDDQLTPLQLSRRNSAKAMRDARLGSLEGKKIHTAKDTPITEIREEQSDSDFLDTPVTFYHHNISHADYGYNNNRNQFIQPPGGESQRNFEGKWQNAVIFKKHMSKIVRDPSRGGADISKTSCAFTTNSKKMVSYFRNHPNYNIIFHETEMNVYHLDNSVLDVMEQAGIKMAGVSNNDIILKAKSLNIPINPDLTITRAKILQKLAADEYTRRTTKSREHVAPIKKIAESGVEESPARAY
jgi:hypothetical protein